MIQDSENDRKPVLARRELEAAVEIEFMDLDQFRRQIEVNVTAQFENAVDTLEAHQLFHRDGYAYVHVSAQAAGVCCTPLTPQVWDPVRYATLSHPGDDYAFDMFSQIAQAMKTPGEIDPMAGLPVRRVIAVGQSQSGTRLRDYLIEVQPQARVIDAFLVHADGSGEKTYPSDPLVPTIQLLSEREATADAPNVSNNYRLWEIAGAALDRDDILDERRTGDAPAGHRVGRPDDGEAAAAGPRDPRGRERPSRQRFRDSRAARGNVGALQLGGGRWRPQRMKITHRHAPMGHGASRVEARRFLFEVPVSFPLFLETPGPADSSVVLGNARGLLPYTVLVGADGRLRKTHTGPFPDAEAVAAWAEAP